MTPPRRTRYLKKLPTRILIALIWFIPLVAGASPRSYDRVERDDLLLTGALGVGVWSAYRHIPSSRGSWTEPVGLDHYFRESWHAESVHGKEAADLASDITLATVVAIPTLLDAVLISGLRDRDWDNSAQTANIAAQSFAFTGIVTASVKSLVGRERPFARGCRLHPSDDPDCKALDEDETYRSFSSGHAAYAFTAAGLACLNHSELRLNGKAGDSAICAWALALASATSYLRIRADKHYLSDVAAGAAIGFVSGFFFPRLSHAMPGSRQGRDAPNAASGAIFPIVMINSF